MGHGRFSAYADGDLQDAQQVGPKSPPTPQCGAADASDNYEMAVTTMKSDDEESPPRRSAAHTQESTDAMHDVMGLGQQGPAEATDRSVRRRAAETWCAAANCFAS